MSHLTQGVKGVIALVFSGFCTGLAGGSIGRIPK